MLISLALATGLTSAQVPAKSPAALDKKPDDDIIRVNSELIQVGITVTDKYGGFVRDLRKDDLQLRVDGSPVTASFFEQVILRASAKSEKPGTVDRSSADRGVSSLSGQGRTIAFVVDDLHLAHDSLVRTRDMVLKFIDEQILPDDTVAIVSTTGKLGFLQQFVGDKTALRAAASRLANGQISLDDATPPPMTAYEAQAIDRLDREITDAFVDATLKTQRGMNLGMAYSLVAARARAILKTVSYVTNQTLSVLHTTTRRAAMFPGRKAIYFISDGFLLDTGNTDSAQNLIRITDAAARSNTVIYSFDAKGLDAGMPQGTLMDSASRPSGRRGVATPASPNTAFQMQSAGRFEMQDGLAYVANNTGGRFVHNTNDLEGSLKKVTDEAFTYYLLAWEAVAESKNTAKLRRIEVSVKDRPDLTVRFHSGYLERMGVAGTTQSRSDPEQKLIAAATSQSPQRDLAVDIALRTDSQSSKGTSLLANVLVDASTVEFAAAKDVATATLEILVLIYNADGKQERAFRTPLDVGIPLARLSEIGSAPRINCDYTANLKPGLYQVRTAVRDRKTGKIGNAARWIEITEPGL